MHTLIISVVQYLKKGKKKKLKQNMQKFVNYDKIFDSDEEVADELISQPKIMPSYIYEFNFEKLFNNGISLPFYNSNIPITLVIGEINVGKTHLIQQLIGTPLQIILKKHNSILCYQDQKQCFLEVSIDWNDFESVFICNVLQKISNLTILINDSVNKKVLSQFELWNNVVIVHKYLIQEQKDFLIEYRKLKEHKTLNNFYYQKGQIHLFYEQNETYKQIQSINLNNKNTLTILEAIQKTLNQSTYLLPFKIDLVYINKIIQLKQQLQNKDIVVQYIKDYYENNEQILKFNQNKDYTLITITKPYLKIQNTSVEIENSQLLLNIMIRDLRFAFIIPFLYKRKCGFAQVQINIQQDDFMILSFS
ncbi:unnamed protein product [Paramecium pentaurelia]|uniref:Uncharacterized protein n=1 Tax=Paramecium pentaurelia TaxID=43138 RepID=A0A8S1WVI0_9CILI|nr:unnamed protein product [Paramecium pentaurelia]